jgi:hypothetical protein
VEGRYGREGWDEGRYGRERGDDGRSRGVREGWIEGGGGDLGRRDWTREGEWGRTGYGGYGAGSYLGGMGTYGERGRYVGRGPKGYKRSDERIREEVNERLTAHPDIDAYEIEVTVRDGEVTLTGSVDDRETKRKAEDVADNVSGVKEVHNQLRIQQPATTGQQGQQGQQQGQQGQQQTGRPGGTIIR